MAVSVARRANGSKLRPAPCRDPVRDGWTKTFSSLALLLLSKREDKTSLRVPSRKEPG